MKKSVAMLTVALIGSPAAAWQLGKYDDHATTRETVGHYIIKLTCYRGQDYLGFELVDLTQEGRGMETPVPLMIWITLPDGRTDKWSFRATPEGPALAGTIPVSSLTLDHFGNGETLVLAAPTGDKEWLRTDMKGTGAARIAFRERCGL
ncbi:MAG: hypothetical protein ACK5IP_00640 [Paracoccus sp. (in: a-proteobacteria)]